MRTTLTIEPDVERLLQREVRRTDKSMKAVVNDALRLGLGAYGKSPQLTPFKVDPHAFGFKPGPPGSASDAAKIFPLGRSIETPPASTLSQSSVPKNPGAQDHQVNRKPR